MTAQLNQLSPQLDSALPSPWPKETTEIPLTLGVIVLNIIDRTYTFPENSLNSVLFINGTGGRESLHLD